MFEWLAVLISSIRTGHSVVELVFAEDTAGWRSIDHRLLQLMMFSRQRLQKPPTGFYSSPLPVPVSYCVPEKTDTYFKIHYVKTYFTFHVFVIINYDFTCRFYFFKVIFGFLDSLFDKYRKWGHKIVRRSDHVAAKFKPVKSKWAPRQKIK